MDKLVRELRVIKKIDPELETFKQIYVSKIKDQKRKEGQLDELNILQEIIEATAHPEIKVTAGESPAKQKPNTVIPSLAKPTADLVGLIERDKSEKAQRLHQIRQILKKQQPMFVIR